MLSLISKITIDEIEVPFSSCTIKTSHDFDTDTASVTLPSTNQKIDTSDFEERNIDILLGYKSRGLNFEFSGIITEVSSSSPIELKCHSHLHNLRKIRLNKRFCQKPLSKILEYAVKETDAKVIVRPDIKVSQQCFWKTARWLVSELAKKHKYVIEYDSSTFLFKKPYLDPLEVNENKLPIFDDRVNIIKNSVKAKGFGGSKKVDKVQVFSENKDGQRIRASFPNKKKVRKVKNEKQVVIEGLSSSKDCFNRAQEIYEDLNAESLEGEIETFGYPFIKPGQAVALKPIDDKIKGVYSIDNLETTFGSQGFRRRIVLGSQIKGVNFPEGAKAIVL